MTATEITWATISAADIDTDAVTYDPATRCYTLTLPDGASIAFGESEIEDTSESPSGMVAGFNVTTYAPDGQDEGTRWYPHAADALTRVWAAAS